MNCELNLCLVVASVFILGVGYANAQNPLMEAASMGDMESERASVAHGADVEAKNNEGVTALTCAEEKGHKEIVRMLNQAQQQKNKGPPSIY